MLITIMPMYVPRIVMVTKAIKMFLPVTIFNIAAILTGLYCLRKGGPVILFLVLCLVTLAFINEYILVPHSAKWWAIKGNILYNIYSLIEITVWFVVYSILFHKSIPLIILTGLIVLTYTAIELHRYSFSEFHIRSYASFSAASLVIALCYFSKISLRRLHPITRDPVFFICTALLCFHSVFLINLFTMMETSYWKLSNVVLVFDVLQIMATILYYLFICIAFIISCYRYLPQISHRPLY
ncbi:hypothetical protein [Ferruginibacter sp.]